MAAELRRGPSGIQPPEINGHSHFDTIATLVQQEAEASKPISFGIYLQAALERYTPHPNSNAELSLRPERIAIDHPGDLAYRGIMAYGTEENEAGTTYYNFFTQRGAEHRVFGNPFALHIITGFLTSKTERNPGTGRALHIQGPTSSGKSRVVDEVKEAFREYTRNGELVYTIEGCEQQCDPMLGLPDSAKQTFETITHRPIHGELCTHCKEKVKIHRGDLLAMPVVPVAYGIGQGIVKLLPQDTANFDQPEVQDGVLKRILGAQRGILEIAELFQHSEAFLKMFMNLARDRKIQVDGHEYRLDTLMLTHSTEKDAQQFKDKLAKQMNIDFDAFEQRISRVHIQYLLVQAEEVALYQDVLDAAENTAHISPKTLQHLANIVLATRLVKAEGLTDDEKVNLYNGEDTPKATQRRDRRRVEAEGREKGEGLTGFPPTVMIDMFRLLTQENPACISPVRALTRIEDYVQRQVTNWDQKRALTETIKNQRTNYGEWLKKTVQQAFRGDYEAACQTQFDLYWEQAELFVTGEKRLDPRTQEWIGPDERFMRGIEEQLGISETDKEEFRRRKVREWGIEKSKKNPGEQLSYAHDLDLKPVLEITVTGETEEDIEKLILSLLYLPKDAQETLQIPDEKVRKRLIDAKDAMIKKNDFCKCCASEMLVYAANLIYKDSPTGASSYAVAGTSVNGARK